MIDICVIIIALSVTAGAEWKYHRSGNGDRLQKLIALMRQDMPCQTETIVIIAEIDDKLNARLDIKPIS